MKERQQNNRKGICNTPLPEHALAASQKYISIAKYGIRVVMKPRRPVLYG